MARSAPFSNGEDPKIIRPRKFKACYCGGHSTRDNKKNLNSHSTIMKESYKLLRELKHQEILDQIKKFKEFMSKCHDQN